jgi:hypothetical protein
MFAASGSDGAGYRYDTTAAQWKELFYTGAALPGMEVFDIMQSGGSLFALSNTMKMIRSEDTGTTWTVDSSDMRTGINGVVLKASLRHYVALNLGTGAWLQSRDVNAPIGTSWASGEEMISAGTVNSMKEYDRRLFLAKSDGLYFKANGSPSAAVKSTVSAKPVTIYPNPSHSGAVTIKADDMDLLEVWDMSGRLVTKVISPAAVYQLQLPAAGTYIVRIVRGGEALSRSVIVR